MLEIKFTGTVEEVKSDLLELVGSFKGLERRLEPYNSVEKVEPGKVYSVPKDSNLGKKIQELNEATTGADDFINNWTTNTECIEPVEEPKKVKSPNVPVQQEAPHRESPAPTSVVPTVPTVATQYEVADLQRIGAELLRKDKSKRGALLNVLASYGVKAVTELAPEHYGAYVQELKGLGADV